MSRFTHASVLLDACACASALLAGVLFPWDGYHGLLRSADVAAIPVLCAAAGLRFSMSAVMIGAGANSLCFGSLIALDWLRNRSLISYDGADIALFAIYLLGASVLGAILATRGGRLAEQAAQQAMRAEAARHGLLRSLRDAHDAGSLLSAARVQAAVLASRATESTAVRALCASLEQLALVITRGRQNAHLGVTETEPNGRVVVADTLHSAVQCAALRFPAVRFQVDCGAAELWLSGGERAFVSMVFNLLINACEGNGRHGASQVRVAVDYDVASLTVRITDDGPGFPASVLANPMQATSSKASGAGVGLYVVHRLVAANSGQIHLSNCPSGGATVDITLSRALSN